MHLDLNNFEFDEEWLREAARIEEEAGCDIQAGGKMKVFGLVNRIDESIFSNDYPKLVELMKERSIVCVLDFQDICRDIAKTMYKEGDIYRGGEYQVSARGIGYIWAETEEDFINQCAKLNLKFLP